MSPGRRRCAAGTSHGQNRQLSRRACATERASAHHRLIVRAVRCPRNDAAKGSGDGPARGRRPRRNRAAPRRAGRGRVHAVGRARRARDRGGERPGLRRAAALPVHAARARAACDADQALPARPRGTRAGRPRTALAPMPLERLEAMGVLTVSGGAVEGRARARADRGPADRVRRVPEGAHPARPRARRLAARPRARVADRAPAGRASARPRHRQRPSGAARRAARRAGDRVDINPRALALRRVQRAR